MVCQMLAAPWVQLSVWAGNGWPHNVLRYHFWHYNKYPDLYLKYVVIACICLFIGLGLARFYTNSPGADKFRPASLSVANNLLSPVIRPRAMFLKGFVAGCVAY